MRRGKEARSRWWWRSRWREGGEGDTEGGRYGGAIRDSDDPPCDFKYVHRLRHASAVPRGRDGTGTPFGTSDLARELKALPSSALGYSRLLSTS